MQYKEKLSAYHIDFHVDPDKMSLEDYEYLIVALVEIIGQLRGMWQRKLHERFKAVTKSDRPRTEWREEV